MDSEGIQWVKTHCGRLDHGGCALLVKIQDNKVLEVKGDPDGYLNKGYTCFKGRNAFDRLDHPDRLRYPLKRAGKRGSGRWQRISWDAALEEIAGSLLNIKEGYGARAVAFGVGMPKGLEHFVLIRLANIFGSPNVVASQDLCHAPREVTGLHTCGFYPVADLHNPSELVLSWGSNNLSTNEEGQISSQILQQLKSGARLIVVDPRRTDLAKRADLWLQPRPGSSQALALGILNVVVEEGLYDQCFVDNFTHGFEDLAQLVKKYTPELVSKLTWVSPDLIRKAARMYAAARPAALQWGNAIEREVNVFDTTRALVCLMAITGNLERPGGNINAHEPKIMGLGEFVRADLIPDKAKTMIGAHHSTIPRMMTVPPAYFRRAVLEGVPYPVKGYYGMCTNPLLAWADSSRTFEALMRLDFMAMAEVFMTPTASLADIVLPSAHQFEMNDIGHYGLGHGVVFARPKLVEPPGECWPDMEILNELGKRISPAEYWHDDHEDFLQDLLKPSGLSYQEFVTRGCLKGPDRFLQYREKGFRTPTTKVELKLSTADKFKVKALPELSWTPAEEPDFPLILISAKSRYYLHSSYRWVESLRQKRPSPLAEIHPETAAALGIEDGDTIFIETAVGRIEQVARLSDAVHPRVVSAAIGWWFPEGDASRQYEWQKSNFNMLTSIDELGREFGTPAVKNLPCRVRKK